LDHLGFRVYQACLVILALQVLDSQVSQDRQDLKANKGLQVSKVALELLGHKVRLGLKA